MLSCKLEFELALGGPALQRKLDEFYSLDATCEVTRMLKPSYGLEGAPKAWRNCPHLALRASQCRQPFAEPEVDEQHKFDNVSERQNCTVEDC